MRAETRLAKLEERQAPPSPPYKIPLLTGDDPEPDPASVPPGYGGVTAIRLVGVTPGSLSHANG